MKKLLEKEAEIIQMFSNCSKLEDVYNKVIEIGQKSRQKDFKHTEKNFLVPGCQSLLYLYSEFIDGKLFFKTHSDALISMGLATLLVWYYSGENPETILKCPPDFLDKLNIPNSLTPTRVNGLYNIHLKMKQKALEAIVSSST